MDTAIAQTQLAVVVRNLADAKRAARIKSVSDALGASFSAYSAHEAFYLGVAHQANFSGWELDRLLYNFLRDVQSEL